MVRPPNGFHAELRRAFACEGRSGATAATARRRRRCGSDVGRRDAGHVRDAGGASAPGRAPARRQLQRVVRRRPPRAGCRSKRPLPFPNILRFVTSLGKRLRSDEPEDGAPFSQRLPWAVRDAAAAPLVRADPAGAPVKYAGESESGCVPAMRVPQGQFRGATSSRAYPKPPPWERRVEAT
jgi:hypothetical protein